MIEGINHARRIVAFVDRFNMPFDRLASQLDCSEAEAQFLYAEAKHMTMMADLRETMSQLNDLAVSFGMSTAQLVATYS